MTKCAEKPPLKWAGGKRWLLPVLEDYWRPHGSRRLVEPFCGGLAVTMGLLPQRALLNDVNIHLINFWRWMQHGLVLDIPLENEKSLYYKHRARFNRLLEEGREDTREAAQLFYYLNRTGYNGLCRFNRQGKFNVPFGKYAKINYRRDFLAYQELFSGWEFTCMDFAEIPVNREDFIYADPPYDVDFRQYSRGGFSWENQVRLAHWLAQHPGPVAASNQATARVVELYQSLGFDVQILEGPRRISCNGDRTPAREMLAYKKPGDV